jgi:hypothetical protein
LRANLPSRFKLRTSPKAYYATEVPSGLTPIPECMPDDYKTPNIVDAYQMYYMMDKMAFARFTPKFDTRPKEEIIKDLDEMCQFKDSVV